jgi:carboxylesterase 2
MVNIPKLGLLLGSQTKSSTGKGIYAFRGIPYAQPPVGELRFKVGI